MNESNKHLSISPPTQSLRLRPKSGRLVFTIAFLSMVSLAILIAGIVLSPFILLILAITVPGIILALLYIKNGFINVTPSAIELSGFTGKISKRITYDSIYQVALVDELWIAVSGTATGYAVVFLDKNGDQVFFAWSIQYTKQDLDALFNLFDPKDRVSYKGGTRLHELKSRFNTPQ